MSKKYTFAADHYFHIGSPHLVSGKPCEDYAASGISDKNAFIVVSDGCSSGGKTDVGSRVVALSTVRTLSEFGTAYPDDALEKIKSGIYGVESILGLSRSDLYATCSYAVLSDNGGYISLYGDGAIVKKYISGKIELSRYEWEGNMPFYPAYSGETLECFRKAHGGADEFPRFNLERSDFSETGEWTRFETVHYSLRTGMRGVFIPVSSEEMKELSFIALFSDGVGAIENTDITEAVLSFTAFKNTKGEFVKRRAIREIKDIERSGRKLLDDIGIAVIEITPSGGEE